ncbi:metal dependent phosphohydrolase [Pochonia chlamydosporia 170]|uniref:Metal dependent phosphohydrolase n=1 Tax=Pochonia chlamydosporia 170 TaxID=1380566 RepID=A0A179FHD8_METCM|nr:metal dependent phosphohydrolase [Pochonia chlamydosporia 170]OAQ64932.1 metal dependent phosphohydrolase [Pochonia chlamydosporia 170]
MQSSTFPSFPISQIEIPSTPLVKAALEYTKGITNAQTVNHCLRSTSFALLLIRKFEPLNTGDVDTEAVVLSTLLHDLGWSSDYTKISKDRRFEVDGAIMARNYISCSPDAEVSKWDKRRLQVVWDAIALHSSPSIAAYKEPEVWATQLGISADFFGPNLSLAGSPITPEEYKEIVAAFPRAGFKNAFIDMMCGLCKYKPDTTYDNFVGQIGKQHGLDGKGNGKDEFAKKFEENQAYFGLMGGLEGLGQFE